MTAFEFFRYKTLGIEARWHAPDHSSQVVIQVRLKETQMEVHVSVWDVDNLPRVDVDDVLEMEIGESAYSILGRAAATAYWMLKRQEKYRRLLVKWGHRLPKELFEILTRKTGSVIGFEVTENLHLRKAEPHGVGS